MVRLFAECFAEDYNTELVAGDGEPMYLAATDQRPAHILFAHGYFASALHEIAHWLVAGGERRKKDDFGYWYLPDGRTQAQQAAFEKVEVKPQALEWILATSCGFRFRFSADNLSGEPHDMGPFQHNVWCQVQTHLRRGLPRRARRFSQACAAFYGVTDPLDDAHYPEP
ncbi:elongation factor P hydroxylase [Acanthopleuribacter pedis]|uniref:elongation factor P hydroxylase n=1 Tax=Acanthopleuribacter pedis TaxID=442870 RepID=UPI003C6EAB99